MISHFLLIFNPGIHHVSSISFVIQSFALTRMTEVIILNENPHYMQTRQVFPFHPVSLQSTAQSTTFMHEFKKNDGYRINE